MTQRRPLVEQLVDLFVYAPVGLAVQLRDAPRLVAEGRAKVQQRVQVARWVGEMTVHYGRRRLEERLFPEPVSSEEAEEAALVGVHHPVTPPFEGYDTLAASEIVQLLQRLPASDLRMVGEYEAANRRRRTVLAKVDQLLGD